MHNRLSIVADENIPLLHEFFDELGDITTLAGRSITPEHVEKADILLVRSVTQVTADLLRDSPVRFVGTATSGIDHIDTECLSANGIHFAYAPGSNARGVGEYVVAALLHLKIELEGASIGIIGHGHVGEHVRELTAALGLRTVLHDPPKARETGDSIYRPLEEALACDVVTLHVPLIAEGQEATFEMMNSERFAAMKPGATFINAARGEVVDAEALAHSIDSGHISACVLDVWPHEPDIDWGLLQKVSIATPHIAGYSHDGKVRGSYALREALLKFLGKQETTESSLEKYLFPTFTISESGPDAIHRAVKATYDIMQDDSSLREGLQLPDAERPAHFDRLRKTYRSRGEFTRCNLHIDAPKKALTQLAQLGFHISHA